MIILKMVGSLKTSKLSFGKLDQAPKDSGRQSFSASRLPMLRKVSFGEGCQLQRGGKEMEEGAVGSET